jgi:hypothetical protein
MSWATRSSLRLAAARHAGKGADLVAGLDSSSGNFPGLPFLRRRFFHRLDRSPDGVDLRRREVLAVTIFRQFAARDGVEGNNGNRNFRPSKDIATGA